MSKPIFLLSLTLIVGSLLIRLYKLPYLAGFDYDQNQAITISQDILSGNLRLIGQESSLSGVFLGPWYYYLMAAFLTLFSSSPWTLHIANIFAGVASTVIIFKLPLATNSKLILLTLYSTSFWYLYHDITGTPTNWLVLLTLFSYWIYHHEKIGFKMPLLWTLAGFSLALNPVGITLIVFPLTKSKLLQSSSKELFLSFIGFSFWLSPLVMFEIKHNFLMTRAIFFSASHFTYPHIFRFLLLLHSLSTTLTTSLLPTTSGLTATILGLVLLLAIIKEKNHYHTITKWFLLTTILLFIVYKGPVYDYYLIPFCLVATIWFADKIGEYTKSLISTFFKFFFLSFFIVSNLYFIYYHNNPFTLADKIKIIEYLMEHTQHRPLKVHLDTDLGIGFGFETIGKLKGLPVTITSDDPHVSIYLPGGRSKAGQPIAGSKILVY